MYLEVASSQSVGMKNEADRENPRSPGGHREGIFELLTSSYFHSLFEGQFHPDS